jgi:hypothetical protein
MDAVIPVALNAVSNAIHVVSALKAKVKANVVTVVVETHAVVVVANAMVSVRENAVLSARLSAVMKFVAKPVKKAETKAVARVQIVVISAMNRALMQKAIKLLRLM